MLYHFVFFHRNGTLQKFSRVFPSDAPAISWAEKRMSVLSNAYYGYSITGITNVPNK